MGKVVYLEDYRKESPEQMWDRIVGIHLVMLTVIQDPRSTVLDLEMVMKLDSLKDLLVDKVLTYQEQHKYGEVQSTETRGSTATQTTVVW